MKPGVIPPCLAPMIVSGRLTSGGPPVAGPRASSAGVIVVTPMRFVNQLESGTSPKVLTFIALGMGLSSSRGAKVFSSMS